MNEQENLQTISSIIGSQKERESAALLQVLQRMWSEIGKTEGREILMKLAFRDPANLDKFISKHPARTIVDALANVRLHFDILERSYNDIIDIAGRFH